MKLTVFGASGGTGGHLVEQALRAGHEVTAVVRKASRMGTSSAGGLEVVTADVMDSAAISHALSGRDAVLSALGPTEKGPTRVCRDATASIMTAMRKEHVARLLVVSNSGNYTEGDGAAVRLLVKPMLRRLLRHAYADMDAMEDAVRRSALDWTIVRPPQLTDKPHTGNIHSSVDGNVRGRFRISRADLAAYLLRAAADDSLIHRTASVAG